MKTGVSMKLVGFLILFSFTACMNAFALSSVAEELAQKARPCKRADILGHWEMIYQKVDPEIKNDSGFFYEDQVWVFTDDGYVRNLVVAGNPTNEAREAALLNNMPRTTKFSFVKDGVLKIMRETDGDIIVISVITAAMDQALVVGAPPLNKGELLLSYMTTPNKPFYMQRYLKKIEIPGVK